SIPWSACTSPNVFEIPVSLNRSGASPASGSRRILASRPAGGAPGRVTLSYFLFGKRREEVDVILVGEPPAGVDMQARESVDLRQANVQDWEISLQPGLLVDDQVGPPAADAGHGRRRQIEPGRVDLPGLLPGGPQIGFDRGGEAAVIRDDQFDVGMRRHIAGERGRSGLRVRVGG